MTFIRNTLFVISLASLAPCYASGTSEDYKKLFIDMDKNEDSSISQDEFWATWSIFFQQRDYNQSKSLTIEEYFPRLNDDYKRLFKTIDLSSDGEVSVIEEKAFRLGHFGVLDANNDEVLNLEELSKNATDK